METNVLFKKALQELNDLSSHLIEDEFNSYTKDYKESKWYREPSLEDINECIAKDIKSFKEALTNKKDDVSSYLVDFENKAKEYGKSWYDEDLGMTRSGYKWESTVYAKLRNIAAFCTGDTIINVDAFYEGIGV